MKTLNRPMFRYGGPIKEGVMSGIREPRANGGSMSQLVQPSSTGMRPGYKGKQLSLFDTVKDATKKTFTTNPLKVMNPAKKIRFASKLTGPIKNFYRNIKSKIDMPKNYVPVGGKLGSGYSGVGSRPTTMLEKAKEFALLNPKTTTAAGIGGLSSGLIPGTIKTGANLAEKGVLQAADLLVSDKYFDQDKYMKENYPDGFLNTIFGGKDKKKLEDDIKKSTETANEKRIKELEALLAAPASENQGKTQDEIRQERIQKYRDIMDIKGMNKTAAYDSLIAASQAVNQAGGDLKGAVRDGSLINQIIQSTSKAFDKPKQTKDAIDTLILKGEIEADIAAGKPSTYLKAAQDMVATGASKNITEAMKTLTKSQNSMSTTLGAILAKGNRLDEKTVGVAYREETGNIPKGSIPISKINEWKEDNEGRTEVDYIKDYLTKAELEPGDYIVGERVVTVDEDKSVSFFY